MGKIEDLLLVLWSLTNSVDLGLNYRIDQDKEDLKRLETVNRTRGGAVETCGASSFRSVKKKFLTKKSRGGSI
jgi:hypothetical protein